MFMKITFQYNVNVFVCVYRWKNKSKLTEQGKMEALIAVCEKLNNTEAAEILQEDLKSMQALYKLCNSFLT